MFLEPQHSFDKEKFTAGYNQNFCFPVHIHRAFECYVQMEGIAVVTVDDKEYRLSPGEAVLIFPYQCHSYEALGDNRCYICIFSPELVPDYHHDYYRIPSDSRFLFPWKYETDRGNVFLRRSFAYGICGEFEKGREYIERKRAAFGEGLLSILMYANEHFCGKCLLRDAALSAQYDYAYISKLFKKSMGMTFNQYVNLLRIQKSQHLLRTTTKSVIEIALECGFSSLRSFNRRFLEAQGTTPSDYRKVNGN